MGRKNLKKKKALARAETLSAAKKRQVKKQEKRQPKSKPEQRHEKASTAATKAFYSVEDYMAKVEEYLDSFQVDLAVKFCERALELEPSNLYVLNTMATVLLEAGETDRAFELFQREVSLCPDKGHTKYLYLGQLTTGEEAIVYLTKGIQVMTQEEGAGQEGGASMEVVGKREELSTAYCALAEVYLTDTCFESEAGRRCYECCCKAVELSPSNPEGYQLMSSCLLSQQLQEKAREALMKGLGLWLPSCRGKKEGEDRTDKEKCDEVSLSEQQRESFPSYSSRVGVAKLLLELEEHDLAFEVLEGLLREDDEVVGVWYLMGWLHYLMKDADSARFYLEQMQELYAKLCCDEEEILSHATELLKELGPAASMTDNQTEGEEGEGPTLELVKGGSSSEDGMDVT